MFGEKATELIKEALRVGDDQISKFNEEAYEGILQEINKLYTNNMNEVTLSFGEDMSILPGIQFRHSCIEHNKRCLLAYKLSRINKISQIRWNIGAVLNQDLESNLTTAEKEWFYRYCSNLDKYMEKVGIDITKNTQPPKSIHIEVRCIEEIGEVVLPDGTVVNLKKDTQHLLPRSFCENLIKQGLLQHIN